MEIIIYLLSILELSTYILFNYFILHSKIEINSRKLIHLFFAYTIAYISIHILPTEMIKPLMLLVYLFVYLFISNGSLINKIKVFAIAWLVAGVIDIIVFALLFVLLNVERSIFSEILSIIVINIIWILISPHTRRFRINGDVTELPRTIYLSILLTCLSCSMMLMTLIIYYKHLTIIAEIIIILITFISLALSIITVFQYINSDNLKYVYLKRSVLLEQDLKLQEEYFNSLNKNYETIRSIHHDMKAHNYYIHTLMIKKEYDELQRYIESLSTKIEEESKVYYCPDTCISAVIYNLYSRMKMSSIHFEFVYLLNKDMILTSIEKSSLFFNLLSNSIESCEKTTKEKRIKMVVDYNSTSVFITIQNSVDSDFSLHNFLERKTSKNDILSHGIGLRNVDDIVNKYNGQIDAQLIEDTIQINILLYDVLK